MVIHTGCGLIKVWKTRYFDEVISNADAGCGLIKVWKTRYYGEAESTQGTSCGLIKVWKTRYWRRNKYKSVYVVV